MRHSEFPGGVKVIINPINVFLVALVTVLLWIWWTSGNDRGGYM